MNSELRCLLFRLLLWFYFGLVALKNHLFPSTSLWLRFPGALHNAPTITKGPYAGEIVTGDHIIPRFVCPELDNALYNFEMMTLTLNQRKSAKIEQRKIDLAKRWNTDGLLSSEGLRNVLAVSL